MPASFTRWLWALALPLVLATGCATAPLQHPNLAPASDGEARQVELSATPFYSQTAYQCGPSALATLLQTSGVDRATPDTLAEQVYLPGRRGSLQTELIAATRRAGRIPYRLEPRFEHLLDELRAGHPVLVLQNLKLPRWPQWHYAVVVGFDLDEEQVILRSGTERRQALSFERFERTWQMGDYWALVVTPPGQTPATASATRYLQAVVPMEQQQRWEAAIAGYRAAAQRWPDNPASHMGLGNIAFQTGRYTEAQGHFEQAVAIDPELPSAHYNLAWALLYQGERSQARQAAERARALAPEHPRFGRAVSALEAEASERSR
ncbi:PA2778 family cysteine peptidase [Marinimicrobium sp. C2-29]|uniref:PA2778 family cysteine peptidase n=1 Tax=Marinimicrobium sp. C2-29 TaxID=3139825 RepID=UPI0031397C4E